MAGVGKSALLANWIERRKAQMQGGDLLFEHFVGSSSKSHRLADLLGRLMTALKEHFELREMDLPDTEDRMRWTLVRYLEAASKKAASNSSQMRIILIVIDGINAVASEGPFQGSLHWLPANLPGNVRFILSITRSPSAGIVLDDKSIAVNGIIDNTDLNQYSDDFAYDDCEAQSNINNAYEHQANLKRIFKSPSYHSEGIYRELCRRKGQFLQVRPLTSFVRGQIILKFLHRQEKNKTSERINRRLLVLEDNQRARITDAHKTTSPLFLRMLLIALRTGVMLSGINALSVDEQLDIYLGHESSPSRIVVHMLDMVQRTIEEFGIKGQHSKGLLGHVLAAVHASRQGLSNEELCGIVDLAVGIQGVPAPCMEAMFWLLEEMTMVVNGFR